MKGTKRERALLAEKGLHYREESRDFVDESGRITADKITGGRWTLRHRDPLQNEAWHRFEAPDFYSALLILDDLKGVDRRLMSNEHFAAVVSRDEPESPRKPSNAKLNPCAEDCMCFACQGKRSRITTAEPVKVYSVKLPISTIAKLKELGPDTVRARLTEIAGEV